MATMDVLDSHGNTIAIEKPLAPGRSSAATSRPVALSSEDFAALDALATAAQIGEVQASPTANTLLDRLKTLHTDLSSVITALGTNHTDEAQLHTDIATTLHADLAAILAKIIAAPATEATLASAKTDLDTIAGAVSGSKVAVKAASADFADGAIATVGAKADAKSTATDATAVSAMSVWKQISASVQALVTGTVLAAGTALVGKFGIDQTTPGTTNAVAVASAAGTHVQTTVAAGGTAANLFSATPANGFEVINVHASEILYIRENGTATVADNSTSIPIPPKSSYATPLGYKPTGDVSYIAATTGHAVIARRW